MDGYEFLGRGFHFPMEAEPETGKLREAEGEEDIKEAIGIILRTKKGERVMRPDFGCDIAQFMFGTMDYTSLAMMERSITQALVLYEPRIHNLRVEAAASEDRENAVLIRISYQVRATNNPYNLVFPFYLDEGMEG